jgi:hypothetical protein
MKVGIAIHMNSLQTIIDRVSTAGLLAGIIVGTFSFACVYAGLSHSWPGHGIVGPDQAPPDIWSAIYFSVTTESTLGYGDFRPVGAARFIVCLQVALGLVAAGMFVAKLTSAPSAHFRELIRSVPGTWIDRVTLSDGTKIFGITAFVSEGTRLRYFGDNVDSQGNYLGLFDAELIDDRLPTLTFRYSNHQSDTTHFTSGINIFNFTARKRGMYQRYSGTGRDFAKGESCAIEGWRLSEPDVLERLAGMLEWGRDVNKSWSSSHDSAEVAYWTSGRVPFGLWEVRKSRKSGICVFRHISRH